MLALEEAPGERAAAKRLVLDALNAACDELGWGSLRATRLGAEAGASAQAATKWLNPRYGTTPSGEVIVVLIRRNAVFRRHLLGATEAAR